MGVLSSSVEALIKEQLDQLEPFRAGSYQLTPLSGGITNRNFLLEKDSKKWVARLAGKDTHLLGIDRSHEAGTSQIVSEADISPKVYFSKPSSGLLICDYISGTTLEEKTIVEKSRFARVIEAIRDIHHCEDFPGIFCPFDTVRQYRMRADKNGVHFPKQASEAELTLRKLERSLAPNKIVCPCHNDLLAANFIDDGKRIWILDWEYAGMGDFFFDLGNFAANQQLDESQCQQLLSIYFGQREDSSLARLKLMTLASDMREAYWGFLQSAISQIEFDFLAYGKKHLERFLTTTNDSIFSEWLREIGATP